MNQIFTHILKKSFKYSPKRNFRLLNFLLIHLSITVKWKFSQYQEVLLETQTSNSNIVVRKIREEWKNVFKKNNKK